MRGSAARAVTVRPAGRRTQAERSATTRRLLLDAAIEAIHEVGFGGATLEVIAQRAGVTRGAVQFHFGNRDDLFIALVGDISTRLIQSSEIDVLGHAPLAERLGVICDRYWQVLNSRHYIAAMQIQIGTLHEPALYQQVSRTLRKAETTLDTRWVELFSDFPAEKIIIARHVVLAALRGMAVRQTHRRARDNWRQERALLLEMLERVLRR